MSRKSVEGVQVRGEDPKFLLLSDGSALVLDAEGCNGRGADWSLIAADGHLERDCISAAEALDLAGGEFAGYVEVRTRAEVEWLRAVAAWCREEADALARDFEQATRTARDAARASEDDPVADDVRGYHLLVGEVPHVVAAAGVSAGPR